MAVQAKVVLFDVYFFYIFSTVQSLKNVEITKIEILIMKKQIEHCINRVNF